MLKLIDFESDFEEYVSFDDYVPVSVEWKNPKEKYKHPTIFWRIGDLSKSMFEIGIDSKIGAIRSLTLLLSVENSIRDETISIKTLSEVQPILDISSFETNYIDCKHNFSLEILNNAVKIVFCEQESVRLLKSRHCLFHFSHNDELLGISIINLSRMDLDKLKTSLSI
ncbi:hypothetical protein [Paenibacillus ihbetae]|uniref:Uncharacterized protein n=1 Tax=Paenibacillus ihbetae TaxID=1870820 RepID=A0ABX3K2M0_9BACL|nr:hypothetical protein [Paenibacillus ihbetae]OOC63671.1 hypothetical protein BBD40_18545 [Paenibacillus ihbetae]